MFKSFSCRLISPTRTWRSRDRNRCDIVGDVEGFGAAAQCVAMNAGDAGGICAGRFRQPAAPDLEEALSIVARESGIEASRISGVVRQGGIYHEISKRRRVKAT